MSLSPQQQQTLKEVQKLNDNMYSERVFALIGDQLPQLMPIELQQEWIIAAFHRDDWHAYSLIANDWFTAEPDNPRALYAFARVLMFMFSFEEAETLLTAVPGASDLILYQYAFGTLYYMLDDMPAVEKSFKRAIHLTTEASVQHRLKSRLNLFLARFEESAAEAQKCLQLDPQDFEAWTVLSDALAGMAQIKPARDAVYKAFDIYPRSTPVQFRLLISLFSEGRQEEFFTFLEEKKPELLSFNGNLIKLLDIMQVEDDPELPMWLLARAGDREPDNPEVHTAIGFLFAEIEGDEDAIGAFEKAIELGPDNPKPYLGLGLALYNCEKYLEALQVFGKVKELLGPLDPEDQDPEHYAIRLEVQYGTALVLWELGKDDEAIDMLMKLLEEFPEHDEAAEALENFLEQRGQSN